MTFMRLAAACMLALLAACSSTPQYLVETRSSDLHVRAAVPTVLVRTVSLPTYAADQKIAVQDDTGSIQAQDFGLWADEPERATTLSISRHLNAMTSAKVAPDPWPLPEPPRGTVDIRIETFIATNRNTFRASGQYFMGSEIPDPIDDPDPDKPPRVLPAPLPDKARLFNIEIPLPARTPADISVAQAAALLALSEKIARDLAR
ncbi:MAG: hypothetical protein EP318_02775 [Rhodobacteraceae bacterium]|nr:MAG: hypothetical protein EP318_02775 [Paracoccaceae bacterium]